MTSYIKTNTKKESLKTLLYYLDYQKMSKIICITEHKESTLIGSIWDLQDLEAKCVMPGNSQYLPGYKVQKDIILYGLENFYVVENLFD